VKRGELEHVLRAASRIVNQRDFLVVGSAAILGTYDDDVLPEEASRSDEADLAPFDDPDGRSLEAHDLAAAKLAAGRPKDYEFVGALLNAGLIDRAVLTERIAQLPRDQVPPGFLRRAARWLASGPP
jgi:hypothetical protein